MKDLSVMNKETMTSTELAELLGKEKKHINEAIRLMFQEKIVGRTIRPTLRENGQVDDYHLPELESKMFVASKDINYLEQITKFWIGRHESLSPAEQLLHNAQLLVDIERRQKEQDRRMRELEEKQLLMSSATGYRTVTAHCKMVKAKLSLAAANKVGRDATELCKEFGMKVGKVPDERFGEVNSYPVEVLEELFAGAGQ